MFYVDFNRHLQKRCVKYIFTSTITVVRISTGDCYFAIYMISRFDLLLIKHILIALSNVTIRKFCSKKQISAVVCAHKSNIDFRIKIYSPKIHLIYEYIQQLW